MSHLKFVNDSMTDLAGGGGIGGASCNQQLCIYKNMDECLKLGKVANIHSGVHGFIRDSQEILFPRKLGNP